MEAEAKTPTEQRLAEIWSEVLGLDAIGRDQDFFQIGGDSLLATKVVLQARRTWKVKFTVRLLLGSPVLKDFAERIEALIAEAAETPKAGDAVDATSTQNV
ncbi:phosphopantetheine-binding protein [Actinacidiphila soli]|uniref:phosphopantetheine-binding protein n=1 Tax=Actinacidiphila soli TaxID=2487275 RepID=UPI0013E28BA3|nr:phosphopantetheine-binding protein [Actinacidiphila soli]